MEITRYFATLGFRVDRSEVRKVDQALNQMEQRLKAFQRRVNETLRINFIVDRFGVNQQRLNMTMGNALDLASRATVFQIDRFNIDQNRLNQQVRHAFNLASNSGSINPRMDGSSGVRGRHTAGAAIGGGLVGRGIGAFYAPAFALAAGGYGLGAVNRRNQEVVSAQLQTQAVVQQAGGSAQDGQASFEWLRGQANRIGFNYLDAAPDFNNLVSGLTGAGMSVNQSQDVYRGFAELARTNKLDRQRQNRLFRALSQVAGKDQLMSEELRGQIAKLWRLMVKAISNNLSNCWKLKLI